MFWVQIRGEGQFSGRSRSYRSLLGVAFGLMVLIFSAGPVAAFPQASPSAEEQINQVLQNANQHLRAGNYAGARDEYFKALAVLEPVNHPQFLLGIAQTYYKEHNLEAAISSVRRVLKINPNHPQANAILIKLLGEAGKAGEAQQKLAELPPTAPVDIRDILNLGIDRFNEGNFAEAIDLFNQAMDRHPEEPLIYLCRGMALANTGEKEKAIKDFKTLIELDPEHPEAPKALDAIQMLESEEPTQ